MLTFIHDKDINSRVKGENSSVNFVQEGNNKPDEYIIVSYEIRYIKLKQDLYGYEYGDNLEKFNNLYLVEIKISQT